MKLVTTIFLFFFTASLFATTISPYPDIKALQVDAVRIVYVQSINGNTVSLRNNYKGNGPHAFEVLKYGTDNAIVWGDINLKTGHNYLLFLDANNRPICLSYYIFEEVGTNFMPVEEADNIFAIDGMEPGGFNKDSLLGYLLGTIKTLPKSIKNTKRAAPSHCTFLSAGGTKVRWQTMPVTSLHTTETEIGSCSGGSFSGIVSNSLDRINQNFSGVSYMDGGLTVFVANCADGTALGPDYQTYLNDNYNSSTGIIIFNDPCSEINDLSSCSGVLAFGGAHTLGTHMYDNVTWFNAAHPFVVVNNGLASCHCAVYDLILSHELTHTLGIGHISSTNGAALMNPFCCNEVSDLDVECLNYAYPVCEFGDTNIWQGISQSNSWFDPINWSLSTIPVICNDVNVPSLSEVILYQGFGPAYAKTLSIDLGSSFFVDLGVVLEVKNTE